MPAILAMLLGGLINIVGTMAGRVLIALGIGIVTYTGVNASLDALKANVITAWAGLPSEVVDILSAMKLGQAMGIVFSAIVARLVLNGLTSGTFKRFVLR